MRVLLYKLLRQVFALQVLLGIVLAFPNLGYAATVSDQISVDADDADQDGIGSDTKIDNNPFKIGLNQYIGLRFVGHGLPNNAVILSASIQFTTEGGKSEGSPSTRIVGEDADSAGTFVQAVNNISDRTTTSASVVWDLPAWPTDGESGPAQQTPDLSAIIQEIVDRPGWTDGNPLVFIFEPNGGDEERLAWTYKGSPPDAATLSIEYTILDIVKRAFLFDGTPIPTSATIPSGVAFKYLLYINDPGAARSDVSVRDVLDAAFQ